MLPSAVDDRFVHADLLRQRCETFLVRLVRFEFSGSVECSEASMFFPAWIQKMLMPFHTR